MYRANRCDSVPSNRLAQKMAKDAELDRLKAAQDSMFTRKQDAYNAQDQAWQARSRARDILNNAHEQKQRAYAVQDASWRAFESVRSSLGPQIDQLNSQQERAFENMKQAFESASSAHSSRDGAGARRYADQGQGYKAEAQSCVARRRQLVDQIRSARASHESAKPGFTRAKEIFNHAKAEFERAKATHEAAQAHFKRAKADFDKASEAFKNRLETVKAANKKRKDEKRSIAQRAGVPSRYLDDVYVSTDSSGTSNIYFGGVGAPDGPGHGHYSIDSSGKVTYRRDPFDPHGSHNFTENVHYDHSTFCAIEYGYIDGKPVTFAQGKNNRVGHTLIADGHLEAGVFWAKKNHDHYGSGDGPNNNGTDLGRYTGPGSK